MTPKKVNKDSEHTEGHVADQVQNSQQAQPELVPEKGQDYADLEHECTMAWVSVSLRWFGATTIAMAVSYNQVIGVCERLMMYALCISYYAVSRNISYRTLTRPTQENTESTREVQEEDNDIYTLMRHHVMPVIGVGLLASVLAIEENISGLQRCSFCLMIALCVASLEYCEKFSPLEAHRQSNVADVANDNTSCSPSGNLFKK